MGGPAAYWQEWTYDEVGSRLTETQHGIAGTGTPGTVERDYAYAAGQPHAVTGVTQEVAAAGSNPAVTSQESYTYNRVGQTTSRQIGGDTQTLSWTPEGRVAEVANADGTGAEYLYDADGNRLISRTRTGGAVETTLYLGHTEISVTSLAPTVAKATRYVDVGGGHVAVIDDDATVSIVLADHQGTGQLAIQADTMALSQRRTTPFGADRGALPADWAGSRGFVGGYDDRDATGLVSLGAREYDPALGRFISLDPIMDLTDPQQIHGYSYANNSPVTMSDPEGLAPRLLRPSDDPGHEPITVNAFDGSTDQGGGGGSTSNVGSTGAASDAPADDETARAQEVLDTSVTDVVLELGWEALKDFVGWNDVVGCLESDLLACGGLLIGVVPVGKGLKALKAMGRIIDGAIDFYKDVKWARGVMSSRAKSTSTVGGACTTSNSFVPGTMVLLADGTSKVIQDIELGDEVLATDETTGQTGPQAVVALITGEGDKNLVTLTVTDNHGKTGTVTATDGHPFWVPALHEWVDAGDLKPGQWLQTAAGTHVQLTAIKLSREHATVHNLTIEDTHTYYVLAGETPVLVHNSSCPIAANTATSATDDWANVSGILRDASRGKGNFGVGSGTAADAQSAGRAWVGEGSRLASDGKTWLSQDGLRQWRPPSFKPRLGIWQSNFESRWVPSGRWQTNGHLDVTDLP